MFFILRYCVFYKGVTVFLSFLESSYSLKGSSVQSARLLVTTVFPLLMCTRMLRPSVFYLFLSQLQSVFMTGFSRGNKSFTRFAYTLYLQLTSAYDLCFRCCCPTSIFCTLLGMDLLVSILQESNPQLQCLGRILTQALFQPKFFLFLDKSTLSPFQGQLSEPTFQSLPCLSNSTLFFNQLYATSLKFTNFSKWGQGLREGQQKYRAIPSHNFCPIFSQSLSKQLWPLLELQKDAQSVYIQSIRSQFQRAMRAVPSLSSCITKLQSSQLYASWTLLIRKGKAFGLKLSMMSSLSWQQPQKKTFFLRECPCMSIYILTLLSLCSLMTICFRQYISGQCSSEGLSHLLLRSTPEAEKRKLPCLTPSTLIMGIILNRNLSRKQRAYSVSDTISLRKPSIMREDTVYPGCTRADSTITSLLDRLPKFMRGRSPPQKELARV